MPDDKKKKPLTETHAQAAENLSERLCTAALNGDLASVKALLATDANVNASDNSGQTPLHYAVKCNDDPEPVINALIAAGADIVAKDKHGYTPLNRASLYPKSLTALVKAAANINAKFSVGAIGNMGILHTGSILHYAAATGDTEILNILITADANVNASDGIGQTPLHYAVKCNDDPEPVINALIAAGADIEALDKHGYTPLQSTGFSIRAATALIKAGAKVTPELQHELDFWKRMVDSSEQLDPPLP